MTRSTWLVAAAIAAVFATRGVAQETGGGASERWPLRDAARQAALVRGEPSIVSSAGITRKETELVTVENPAAFEASAKRRVVFVGGFGGSRDAGRAVAAAVTWMKSAAPAHVRQAWAASALVLADPDSTAGEAGFAFPPEKGFFDDAAQPESRYVWRWTVYQAPDLVVIVKGRGDRSADALAAALSEKGEAGLGSVPAVVMAAEAIKQQLPTILATHASTSPLHQAILDRVSRDPLRVARVLARRYPQQIVSSYIPSVAWTNMLRLSTITGEDEWRAKVYEQTGPWLRGETKPLTGDRTPLTSIAGYMIFAELAKRPGDSPDSTHAAHRMAEEGAVLAGTLKAPGEYANGSGWTDDMFMATAVLARVSGLPNDAGENNPQLLDAAASLLTAYAARLQRADGIFSHAVNGPVAWGRGNGFAAFGMMEALTAMGETHPRRSGILDMARRQMSALKEYQAPDGMFRQVIDEPGSYREETATAMLLSAMSRGVRRGWLDRSYIPVARRAWRALAAHISDDASLVDVCTGTGSGPTLRYYLDRPAIDGFDDRGGAMALLAAVETYELANR